MIRSATRWKNFKRRKKAMEKEYTFDQIINHINFMINRERENTKIFYSNNPDADGGRKRDAYIYETALTELLYRLEN